MSNEQNKKMINTVEKELPKGAAKFSPPLYEDVDEHKLDVALLKELEEQGLEHRFIDFKKAKLNGGRSRAGWIVYKRQSVDPRLNGIAALADPDGLVRDGSLVLAVKPKAGAERQRERVQAQNRVMSKYTEHVTKEVAGDARRLGGSSRAITGYDKNS